MLCLIAPTGKSLVDSLDQAVDAIGDSLLETVSDTEVNLMMQAMDKLRAAHAARTSPRPK